jgi:isoleucyl-tRNA synthetase
LDRWILSRLADLEQEVARAYDACEFHVVYQKLTQFAAVELSAIYHDVVKDRLYTDAPDSLRRRSTQTALHRIATRLCQMLAPVLAFTADEAWTYLPAQGTASVHLSVWEPEAFDWSEEESSAWKRLFALREQVLPELEKARQAKLIGKALEASMTLRVEDAGTFSTHAESLRELLNVSQLQIEAGGTELSVEVAKADGSKCGRCWHWEASVGAHATHPLLCDRCAGAVEGLDA